MTLNCYKTVSNNNVRSKDLTLLSSLTLTKLVDNNLVNPKVLVNKFTDWDTCNYVQMLGRYYYVTSIDVKDNSKILLNMHSDVLANVDLSKVTGVLEKTSSTGKYNVFCNNQTQMFLNQKRFQYFKFSDSLPSPSILLTVNGN